MNESKATRYQRGKRRAQAVGVLSGGALLAVLALTPAGAWLAAWVAGITASWPWLLRAPLALVLFTGACALLWEIAWLPAVWYLESRVDTRYGRRTETRDALVTQVQTMFLGVAVAILAGAAVQVGAALGGTWWWLIASSLLAAALVTAMHIGPAILARAAGAQPLERPALVELLGGLARRVRVSIDSIDGLPESASVTETALVAGASGARRVFIAAELLRDWPDEEITVVVAHELAHHAHHDLWQTLAVDVVVLAAGFWTADRALALAAGSAAELAALPLIALIVGGVWLLSAPIRHAVSRWQERRADAFALRLTGRADAFQAAIRRLAARHLAEERPSLLTRWWFHRHPPAAERLRVAESRQRRG
jgi:STE24 endopeptidase